MYDVSTKNLGHDITSLDLASGELRLIEVKGLGGSTEHRTSCPCACRKLDPHILVMQSAKDRTAEYEADRLNGAGNRRILVQGQVRTRIICTPRLANAHGTEFRELLYPWHPWCGLRVGIYAAVEKSDGPTG